ncbi:IscS subfamily cysteine desulfurase [Reyranella sp.]|jgi:cysteine desulfurase|uniref:IscS subfamily cysteine desulfurase n=1 Tax=Reyranella sp. TaxID=1929291 RepID=UPI000BCBF07E|nr:IscS subfamily cysteine desulfurase [Reyranella sp.]OYY35628.1 MAG: IscS subfamily cysteine desulfurase [Rhodospirillales bacterium 35-66-84]OYZ91498.1 MAG: IscS subfamily cysteine desulfurase [Rhodospirillales bacterium 24-66-33]OZB22035.1 MAG: IscS subfamily cysteine desulfurase [Rhodospirillales bacterium 39-66-50]HQS14943.1 IscS subfamily cysteine desulfurase [Reyranella sp.]HQT10752.1 IscS subfamily cysteine desulfurase [Reyranella sp.]
MTAITQIRRNDQPIYLDYQATTPMDPRVLEAMMPYFTHKFGNSGSRSHAYGWEAEEGTEKARAQVAKLIGADEKEVIFTSGATESNNLAIRGVAEFYKDRKNHIITTVTEHKCVLDTCRHLEQQGFEVTYLPVRQDGLLDLEVLRAAITDKTVLVSVMAVNNEIGVIQPLAEIGKICREKKVFFHTDAAQAAGKIPLDVEALNIDLMSISGHKIYGPKGIGALYVRRKPRVRLVPMIVGGGQERGFRSGTLPTPLCVGLGEAAEICMKEMDVEAKRLKKLQERMLNGLRAKLTDIVVNGDLEQRIPGNLNISFAYVEGESLMMGIKNLAVSSGSACTSASLEPSYVLRALGVEEEMAHTSLRIGLGRFTTEHEVDTAVDELVRHVNKLREMSPLWEMAQEGIDIKSIEWAAH